MKIVNSKRKSSRKNKTQKNGKVTVNRQYKNTIFQMIFHEKKELLSLYNALNDTTYEDEEELNIVTLENAVYMSMKNDLAFILDMRIHMYEHQSTHNPNIPLRNLFYVSQEYQALVLNINQGSNEDVKKKCRTLQEYMLYIERIRFYIKEKEKTLQDAVETAVDECIREGILEDFLKKNKAEAIAVSIFEYDEEKELRLLREAEREYGIEIGKASGLSALVRSLKRFLSDFETLYAEVISNEEYKEFSREEVLKIFEEIE